MPDNVTLPGTGSVVATDDDGAAQHQYVKLEWGADNVFNKVSTGVSSLPVQGAGAAGAAVSGNPVLVAGSDGTNARSLTTDTSGRVSTFSALSASGSLGALNATVAVSTVGLSAVAVDLRGTFSLTCMFQGTVDGTNWVALQATPIGSAANVALVTTSTTAGAWLVNCAGCTQVRAIATAYTSGSATVAIAGDAGPGWVYQAPVGATNAITVSSGTVTTVSTVSNVAAIAAGANAIGDVGVQYRANATGAASRNHLVAAGTTNATVVKASAGRLLGYSISNTTASWRYLKFHNQSTAPTAGTGVVQTVGVPPNATVSLAIEGGIGFATGIAFTTVTGVADADATAVTAADLVIDIFFA